MFTQYASPLLVLGFTSERFISIYRPFQSDRFSRTHRGPKEIIAILIVAIVLALPQAHIWSFTDDNICYVNGTELEFLDKWSWATEISIFVLVPVITLVLNLCVMRVARRSLRNTMDMPREQSYMNGSMRTDEGEVIRVHRHRHDNKMSPSTATLMCVSFYRIFTLLPVTVVFALQASFTPSLDSGIPRLTDIPALGEDREWRRYFIYIFIRKVVKEICFSYYACNVFIYWVTAKQFRRHLKTCMENIKHCTWGGRGDGGSTSVRNSSTSSQHSVRRPPSRV